MEHVCINYNCACVYVTDRELLGTLHSEFSSFSSMIALKVFGDGDQKHAFVKFKRSVEHMYMSITCTCNYITLHGVVASKVLLTIAG